jgi:hypothetical protein
VTSVIKRQIKLLNFEGRLLGELNKTSVDKMAVGDMKLDAIKELVQARYSDDIAIISIIKNCPMLQDLDLSGYTKITDMAIINIAEYCPMLQNLGLFNATADIAMTRIPECCPMLQTL